MKHDDDAGAPEQVDRSVISVPLLERMQGDHPVGVAAVETSARHHIVVDLNYAFPGGVDLAARKVRWMVELHVSRAEPGAGDHDAGTQVRHATNGQFLFACLSTDVIEAITALDRQTPGDGLWRELAPASPFPIDRKHFRCRAIHRIWPDFETKALGGA